MNFSIYSYNTFYIKMKVGAFVLVSLCFTNLCFSQNDCVDAIYICGNANLSGLTTNGIGIQEISADNACSSGENNSLWLKIKINTGGTLGFILTPQSPAIVEDLDFWIFGPNVECSNLGTAIRCSTTNPLAINQTDNLTGMNSTETDVSEGPGPDGNGYVKWLDVLANETYYIAIDRPIGVSAFSIAWTGTATFYQPPVPVTSVDIQKCSLPNLLETAIFDLTPNINLAIGSQTNVSVQFFTNYSNAVANIAPITNVSNFQNTVNPQQIFIRLSNNVTGCFAISDFDLSVALPSITEFSYATPICINENNPIPFVANGFTTGGLFSSTVGLSISPTTGTIDLANSIPGNYLITYSLQENIAICQNAESFTFPITINPLPTITLTTVIPPICINSSITPINFTIGGLATNASITMGTLPTGVSANYSNGIFTISGTPTITGTFDYTITTSGGCSPNAFYDGVIKVSSLPIITLPQDGYICIDEAGASLGVYKLLTQLNSMSNTFVWSNSTGTIIGQNGNSYLASLPGDYSVTVTNNTTFCSATATATIATFYPPFEISATVTSYFSDVQTLVVAVLPIGNYEYKLDSNPYQDYNEFTNLTLGIHEIWVRDKKGCGVKKLSVQIVNYPHYFTPNGDGFHDIWNISELKNQPKSVIQIYDRYGKFIKQINPSGPGWDGTYNGLPMPATDYWFTVDYIELSKKEQFKAHFSLIR
jgi:gliding motility-associated-like protein